ncbi:hypothetical protein Lal_00001656 [Lupinus albus]|nr:hypothetical protein Lal_00001656 [Lupinus albus]
MAMDVQTKRFHDADGRVEDSSTLSPLRPPRRSRFPSFLPTYTGGRGDYRFQYRSVNPFRQANSPTKTKDIYEPISRPSDPSSESFCDGRKIDTNSPRFSKILCHLMVWVPDAEVSHWTNLHWDGFQITALKCQY